MANPRLPIPGADDGIWGDLLNNFLAVEHYPDGSLKLRDETYYKMPSGGIPQSDLSASVRAQLNNVGQISDATAQSKGAVRLTGALAGTADNPAIANGAIGDTQVSSLSQGKINNLQSDLASKAGLNQSNTFTKGVVINEPGAGVNTLVLPDTTTSTGISFGNGDTNIFRSGNGQLQTSSAFFAVRATLGVVAVGVTTSGDSTRRFQINTDGKLLWSAGSGTQDTLVVRETNGGLKINNTAGTSGSPGTPTLSVVPQGTTSDSTSGGGALLVNNGTNTGAGLIVYSNAGAGATGRLVNIRADNAAFTQPALHVDYDGTGPGVEILHNGTGTNGNALNVLSTNQNDTAVGIIGAEISKGTVKIVHNYPGVADPNASALSLRANGSGTQAQGIFFDAEDGGTTGNLMKFRNAGDDKFIMHNNGSLYTKSSIQVGSTVQDVGGGLGVIGIKDAATVPYLNPTDGIIMYAEGGVLKYRDENGSIYNLTGGGGSDANSQPNDQGYKGWSYDPVVAANLTAPQSGQPVLIKVKAAVSGTVSNIHMYIGGTGGEGSGFTADASFAALYDLSGNRLAQSNDLATTFNSTGNKSIALTTSASVNAGTYYYIWLVVNATDMPTLARGSNIGVYNVGLSAGTYRFATLGSGISSPPSTITLGSSAPASISYWAAIS